LDKDICGIFSVNQYRYSELIINNNINVILISMIGEGDTISSGGQKLKIFAKVTINFRTLLR
jgi:hypothetical protein